MDVKWQHKSWARRRLWDLVQGKFLAPGTVGRQSVTITRADILNAGLRNLLLKEPPDPPARTFMDEVDAIRRWNRQQEGLRAAQAPSEESEG